MDPVNLLGVLLGVGALALIVLAIFRGEFREIETPKYEMLGREPPQEARPAPARPLGDRRSHYSLGAGNRRGILRLTIWVGNTWGRCACCAGVLFRGDGAACS
jgi:hypothetical protein